MKITTHTEEDVTIVSLVGRLTIGEGDVQLRETVNALLDQGIKKLLINLEGLRGMDSSGLGELVRCRQAAENAGTAIKLLHVEDKVQEVLEMTRLIGIFETYDDPAAALASFRD